MCHPIASEQFRSGAGDCLGGHPQRSWFYGARVSCVLSHLLILAQLVGLSEAVESLGVCGRRDHAGGRRRVAAAQQLTRDARADRCSCWRHLSPIAPSGVYLRPPPQHPKPSALLPPILAALDSRARLFLPAARRPSALAICQALGVSSSRCPRSRPEPTSCA